jgi:hypothetical protein
MTIPLDWVVKRRYSDFGWLRERLVQSFPGSYIPPLPVKKSRGRLQESFVLRRKFSLESFLNAVVRNPLFARSIAVEMFLKERDPKTFGLYKKEKVKCPGRIEEYPSLDGNIQLNLTNEFSDKYA